MKHRFDKLARRAAKELWDAVCTTIDRINKRVEDGESYRKILDVLSDAENFARDALRIAAKALFVLPLPDRKRAEATHASAREPSAPRAPMFRLGLAPIEREALGPTDHKPGEVTQAERPRRAADPDQQRLASRLAALNNVLQNPGRHAARYARAIHRREDEAYASFTLKCEDDILLDHIDRFVDDPTYYGTDAFRLTHAMFFDSS